MTDAVAITCQLTLGGVFLLAAIRKATTRAALTRFAAALRALAGVPARLSSPAAMGGIVGEAGLAVLLFSGVQPLASMATAAGALAAFTVVLVRARLRRSTVSCNCFGIRDDVVAWRHVVRNGGLIAVALLGSLTHATSTADASAPTTQMMLFCGTVATCVVALVALIDNLHSLLYGSTQGRNP